MEDSENTDTIYPHLKNVISFSCWLDDTWNNRKINNEAKLSILRMLDSYFDKAENPFSAALNLLECFANDKNNVAKATDSLPHFVWTRFIIWQRACMQQGQSRNWAEYFNRFLTSNIVEKAALLAMKNWALFPLACVSFRFSDQAHNTVFELFSEKIRELSLEKNYFAIAIMLEKLAEKLGHCCSQFDETMLRRTILLLVWKNKFKTAIRLLTKIEPAERVYSLVAFVDSFIGIPTPNERLAALRFEFEVTHDDRFDSFVADHFEANAVELCKNANVPSQYYRNTVFIDMRKKIGFIIGITFEPDGEMDTETFRELVLGFVNMDSRFKEIIVRRLIESGNSDEASYWAERFNLSEILTESVVSVKRKNSRKVYDTSLPVYKLPLNKDAVIFVDSVEKYCDALRHILSVKTPVGVDSEWPCILLPHEKQIVSILQLSLTDRVYLIDLLNLSTVLTDNDWQLLLAMFKSSEIQKIAFDFRADSSMLRSSFSDVFRGLEFVNLVDLKLLAPELWESLRSAECDSVPLKNGTILETSLSQIPGSLADMSQRFLGCRISKRVRKSNWNRRPLSEAQLLYAAIDAHCLIEIYHVICHVISSQNLKIDVSKDAAATISCEKPET